MRYGKLLLGLVPLMFVAACGDDTGVNPGGPPPPAATVRFINVGTDWGPVDFRFIDVVENVPTFGQVAFRGTSGFYQRVQPGTRPARVWPYSENLDTTQMVLAQGDVQLGPDQRYTFVYLGRAAAGAPAAEQHRLLQLTDPAPPAPPAGQIALQALHAIPGAGAVDVYVVPVDSANSPTPADWRTSRVGVIPNVQYGSRAAAYVNVPARPTTGATLRFYRFVVAPAGSTAGDPIFAATPNQPGVPAPAPGAVGHGTVPAQSGVQIAGSVMTAVIAPGSTPGTRGSAAANQAPTVFLVHDRQLLP
jgi:hypothetical protein